MRSRAGPMANAAPSGCSPAISCVGFAGCCPDGFGWEAVGSADADGTGACAAAPWAALIEANTKQKTVVAVWIEFILWFLVISPLAFVAILGFMNPDLAMIRRLSPSLVMTMWR